MIADVSGQDLRSQAARPLLDSTLPPEIRAALVLDALTLEEKIGLVHGHVAFPFNGKPKPNNAIGSAGYVEGVPRLGIPALQESDAGLGISTPHNARPPETPTPFPSALA